MAAILVIELGLRLLVEPLAPQLFDATNYIWGERFWFGRNQAIAKKPIAAFDRELGWVSDRPFDLSKSERPIVAVFGDSWAYGLGVSSADAFPARLSRKLGVGTRNFGVPGYGVDQMVLLSERVERELRPQTIILAFITSDLHRSCFPFYFGKRKPKWPDFAAREPIANHVKPPEELGLLREDGIERWKDIGWSQILRSRLLKLFVQATTQSTLSTCIITLNAALLERAQHRFGDRLLIVHLAQDLPKDFESELRNRNIQWLSVHREIETLKQRMALDAEAQHPGPRYHDHMASIIAEELAHQKGALKHRWARHSSPAPS